MVATLTRARRVKSLHHFEREVQKSDFLPISPPPSLFLSSSSISSSSHFVAVARQEPTDTAAAILLLLLIFVLVACLHGAAQRCWENADCTIGNAYIYNLKFRSSPSPFVCHLFSSLRWPDTREEPTAGFEHLGVFRESSGRILVYFLRMKLLSPLFVQGFEVCCLVYT